MKKILTFSWLLPALIIYSSAFAQISVRAKEYFDPKVDAVWYWMRAAKDGIVPYNPKISVKPAKILPPLTKFPKGVLADSPDVPIYSGNDATESEVSIFVNPNNEQNILNSNNSTSWDGSLVSAIYGANYFLSSDSGLNWSGSIYGAGGNNYGDPTAIIGLNGRQYVGFIASDGGQGVAYSDNGSTWTHVQVSTDPGGFLDKNHLWIDNSPSSPYKGNIYDAWTRFDNGDPNNYRIELSRSTNDGVTWSSRINISSGTRSEFDHGVNLQTGPNGEVYAIWAIYVNTSSDLNEDGIGFAKSTDGGATWQPATEIISNIKGIRDDGVSKNMRCNSFPVMAVDISNGPNRGNIYVVWANRGVPGINAGTNISVYMIRSTDGGSTWSTPVRVNQGAFADSKEAYQPWITCDPVTGALSTIFYDDRNTASTDCEAWVANSTDGGLTWTDFRVSDVSFTPSPIPGLAGGYMGDYLGISARNGIVYPVWTDNRSGKALAYTSPYLLSSCPSDLIITDNVNSGQTDIQEASNTITLQNIIFSGATAEYDAGQTVYLKPNFHAKYGSNFRAHIDGCQGATYLRSTSNISYNTNLKNRNKEVNNEIHIKMFPNPTKGILKIKTTEDVKNWNITNVYGNSYFKGKSTKTIDISNLPKGIYVLKAILNNGKVIINRIIKE